jgi:hypothetical protein
MAKKSHFGPFLWVPSQRGNAVNQSQSNLIKPNQTTFWVAFAAS